MATPTRFSITGFEPFGKFSQNPSELIVRELANKTFDKCLVDTLVLPVSFQNSATIIKQWLNDHHPYDYIISFGLANSRQCLSLERIGINCMDASKPDNDNVLPQDLPIDPAGPPAIFSTLPIKMMKTCLGETTEIPIKISNSAGTYVCNTLLYTTLNEISKKGLSTKCGFIHLPSPQLMPHKDIVSVAITLIQNLRTQSQFGG